MVFGVSTDISETVFAAQELAAVNATLEQRVEERTITLEKARQDLEYANCL